MRILLLALLAFPAWAQVPTSQPTTANWFADLIEIELRLRGAPTGAVTQLADMPTVKVVTAKMPNYWARNYVYTVPCWNKTTVCPKVIAVSYRVMLKLPWSTRMNVTRFTNCEASECLLAGVFAPLQAKPGQGYSFNFDRIEAVWGAAPAVVSVP